MDEIPYSRADRINAGVCLVILLALAGVCADVLFDLSGRVRGRRLAGQVEDHLTVAGRD